MHAQIPVYTGEVFIEQENNTIRNSRLNSSPVGNLNKHIVCMS